MAEWYQRSHIEPAKTSQASSLNDLSLDRESERRFTKKPSKVFRDWLRWEQRQLKFMMADLERQKREAFENATYDPLEMERVVNDDCRLSDVKRGDVLLDPKRPGYCHPLLLQVPKLEKGNTTSKG